MFASRWIGARRYCRSSLVVRSSILQSQLVQMSTSAESKPSVEKPMLRHQEELPRLPVLDLKDTCMKYIYTARPFATDAEIEKLKQDLADLLKPGGTGERLQSLLQRRAQLSKTSWLEDWWYKYAYLEVRDPIPVNVNYFYAMRRQEDHQRCARNSTERAAAAILGALDFRNIVERQQLSVDMIKETPLSMEQYPLLFSSCRIPETDCDSVVHGDSRLFHHIVVLRKGQLYAMDVCDTEGNPLPMHFIKNQLEEIKQRAESQCSLPIGLFSAEERNRWALLYKKIKAMDIQNAKYFDLINNAIFAVCLDEEMPSSFTDVSMQYLHGTGMNRWFDKQIQVIVCDNGEIGFNFEHAHIDGLTTLRFVDHIFHYMQNKDARNVTENTTACIVSPSTPRHLNFVTNSEIQSELKKSEEHLSSLINGNELFSKWFTFFGTESIKKYNLSPDAFVQLAFQLAYRRLHQSFAPTYESASTRQFYHGRTETGRSCLPETVEFCQKFLLNDSTKENNNSSHQAELRKSMENAISALALYMKEAKQGKGVDRHLLGLKMIANEEKIPLPAIFSNPLYQRTNHWRLSTSHCGSASIEGFGFGPVVPDGYGIGYFMLDDKISFTITAKRDCATTNARSLMEAIEKSLKDLFRLACLQSKL